MFKKLLIHLKVYYLFIFILLSLFSFLSLLNSRTRKINYYWILFFFFVFTAGLRFETGTDYFSYQEIFNQTNSIDVFLLSGQLSDIPVEPLYSLLNSVFKTFKLNLNFMFLFISFVTNLLLFSSFKKYLGRYKILALVTYYCFVYFTLDMSGVRQSIAINIFLFSFRYIKSKSFLKYFLLVFIAALFHVSALLCLVFYFILDRTYKSIYLLIFLILGFLVIYLKVEFITILIDSFLVKIFPATAVFKLLIYSNADKPWVFNIKIILFLFIFMILLYNRENLFKRFTYFNIVFNSLFFYLIIRMFFWESIEISGRTIFYFIFGLILALPMVLDLIKNNVGKVFYLFIFLSFNFYQSFEFYFKTNLHNPYQNYIIHKAFKLESNAEERLKLMDEGKNE
jgi:hypothetical protein